MSTQRAAVTNSPNEQLAKARHRERASRRVLETIQGLKVDSAGNPEEVENLKEIEDVVVLARNENWSALQALAASKAAGPRKPSKS